MEPPTKPKLPLPGEEAPDAVWMDGYATAPPPRSPTKKALIQKTPIKRLGDGISQEGCIYVVQQHERSLMAELNISTQNTTDPCLIIHESRVTHRSSRKLDGSEHTNQNVTKH